MKCLVSHNGPGGICLQRKVQHETHKCDYVSESLQYKYLYDVCDIETKHTHRTTKWMYMSMTRHMEPQSGRTCEL